MEFWAGVVTMFAVFAVWGLHRTGKVPVAEVAPPPAPHPCAAYHRYRPIGIRMVTLFDQPATSVLYRCPDCEARSNTVIMGSWDMDQLEQMPVDAASLERLMGGGR